MKELAQTSKELLDTTKESVDILKGIRSDLASDDIQPLRSKPPEGSVAGAPAEAVPAAEGGSLLGTAMDLGGDLLGRGKRAPSKGLPRGKTPSVPAKAGLGSRMMGGIKSVGGKLGGLARGAAGIAGKLALPLAVAGAGYSAYQGVGRAGENFDLKEGEEATLGQKTSSALGSVASGFTFGMVDEKEAAQGINKAGSAVKDFFGFGDKETSQKFPLKDEGTTKAKPAETVAGKKGSSGVEGQADDQKLIDEFVKAYPPSKGFTYEAMGQGLTISKDGKKVRSLGRTFSKQLKTMDAATFAGLAMKSGGPTAKTEAEAKPAKTVAGKKDVTAKMDDNQVGVMQPAAAEGKLSSDPQMDQDIRANQKRVAEVTPSKPSPKSSELSTSSLEYTDLDRERSQSKPAPAPIIMNNSSNNSTTKIMPMKADPRPSDRGSAYERHLERTSAY